MAPVEIYGLQLSAPCRFIHILRFHSAEWFHRQNDFHRFTTWFPDSFASLLDCGALSIVKYFRQLVSVASFQDCGDDRRGSWRALWVQEMWSHGWWEHEGKGYCWYLSTRENSFNLMGFTIFPITFILQPEYLAINPFHNIPALKDGDFCLNESRVAAKAWFQSYDDKPQFSPSQIVYK